MEREMARELALKLERESGHLKDWEWGSWLAKKLARRWEEEMVEATGSLTASPLGCQKVQLMALVTELSTGRELARSSDPMSATKLARAMGRETGAVKARAMKGELGLHSALVMARLRV